MGTEKTCQHCGKPIDFQAVGGLCPECMLKVGLGSGLSGQKSSTRPLDPPDLAQIAAKFPQLEVLELLGKGGMGAVYKARQRSLDRLVALKILPPETGSDPGFAERFTREARALAKLGHPNIVAVHEFGQIDGLHYFIMEYVDGASLRQIEQSGKLTARQALEIIPQICEALQFAHDEGIVHRDIKPENVLLDKKGRVKIADFGLAKILGRDPQELRLTGVKDVMGTPHYMAPEQIERPAEVDHRADIYSLGVVFYEMLTGELPLGKFAPPSRKVQVDVRLDEVVLHALEKEPELRYQQASQVKTDVEQIQERSSKGPTAATGLDAQSTQNARSERQKVDPTAWAARVLGLAGFLVVLLFISMEGFPPMWRQPVAVQVELLATLLMLTGLLVGWKSEGWGAALILDGWILFLIAERGFPPLPFTVFLVPAALYGYSWYSRRIKSQRLPPADRRWWLIGGVGAASLALAAASTLFPNRGPLPSPSTITRTAAVKLVSPAKPGSEPTNQKAGSGPNLEAAAPTAVPHPRPVVIATVPQSGSSEVDPSLTELRATFSTAMQDGSWSWAMLDQEHFPQLTGQPRLLDDGRTCLLPVKLKPGKVYAIWLNSENFQGFRDRAGHSAVPYLLIFQTRK